MQASLLPHPDRMYKALLSRDSQFEGIFVVAVKTTGIFCRPTCPARKPKRDNVEFFPGTRHAVLAGYRPCLRCRPLEVAGTPPSWMTTVLERVETDPQRRFTDRDLRRIGVDPARVRRWFHRHHGMTFHAYQRARRLGLALGKLRSGEKVTTTALDSGFDSLSGFNDAFKKLFGATPTGNAAVTINVTRVLTPLGAMVAGATDEHLCFLEFGDRRAFRSQIATLAKRMNATFVPGDNAILQQTQAELRAYFDRDRQHFDVPLSAPGTAFQESAWEALLTIPYGETRSYSEQAKLMGRPGAVRAVGTANGANRIAVIIPCHRVVGATGALCGYGGELWRKQALLDLERTPAWG